MKEGILKKIAIGVVVSLASTAIIAAVSGLFSGNTSSSSNGGVCAHETRTTDNSMVATCTVGGVQGMVRCLDCGEITVEGEELPPTGHTGEIGETCTVCNEPIYGQYQNPNFYSLQDFESGEKVVGNWYRIYVSEKQVELTESNSIASIITGLGIRFRVVWQGGSIAVWGDNAYTFTDIDDLFLVFYGSDSYDSYVDVYFKEGVIIDDSHPDVDENGETIFVEVKTVVDKDTTLSNEWPVKRLVFSD